ncbi:MAG: family 43 glycosylhydrolase [Bacteroidales bacterium]|nr:family 43 glycosylhydrolase [Bacteroidales bacterium]
MKYLRHIALLCALLPALSCGGPHSRQVGGSKPERVFVNPLRDNGSSPCLVSAGGRFYYLQSSYVRIGIWSAESIEGLKQAQENVVYSPERKYYISGPQLIRLDGKWYIYYSCEGADMSTREIHVLENPSEDPLEGGFVHKAVLRTGCRKSVHPHVCSFKGQRYLLWSGSDESAEIVRFNIHIARLQTPWRLSSKKSVILQPKYEWECQWTSEGDNASDEVVYVNEAPQLLFSRDSTRLLLYFSASQTHTPYYCEGLAWADADCDPLDARSWHKLAEPVFSSDADAQAFGAGHLSFFRDASDSLYLLYQAYSGGVLNRTEDRSPRMQPASWGADGVPVLGRPLPLSTPVREPSVAE